MNLLTILLTSKSSPCSAINYISCQLMHYVRMVDMVHDHVRSSRNSSTLIKKILHFTDEWTVDFKDTAAAFDLLESVNAYIWQDPLQIISRFFTISPCISH